MDTIDNALKIFNNQKSGILRVSRAKALGIHPNVIYKLRDEGKLIQVTEGFYRLSHLPDLQNQDLVIVSLRAPKAVICLISALSFHDMTTQIPHEVSLALPKGIKAPRLEYPPTQVFHFSDINYKEGMEIIALDGVEIKVYNPAKTIVDCFRFEKTIGLDIAIEALKLAKQNGKCKPNQIMTYARIAKIQEKIRPFVQQEFA